MAHRPAKVYTGTGWDDIGDTRLLTHNHDGSTGGVKLPQSSITNLTTDLAAKAATVTQATAPTGKAQTIWYDSSTTPPTPKFWDGSAWQPFSSGVKATVSGTTGSPTITTSGGKTIYQFTASSGSITIGTAGLVHALVLGGGGSGAATGGGGGAGQYIEMTKLYLAAGTYSIVVGAGGASVNVDGTNGNNGGTSSLGGISAIGGGGGQHSGNNAKGGGSGGGCGYGSGTGGVAAADWGGKNGGTGGGHFLGGGGGGAGQIGGNASGTTQAGNGGNGVASTITGSSVARAGGGGGGGSGTTAGTGGTGGGGAGSVSGAATAGTANTGSGGGASKQSTASGAGGSGVVIIAV